MTAILLIHVAFWLQTSPYDSLFRNSIEGVNERYANSNQRITTKFNSLSEDGGIRQRFYSTILEKSKIANPAIVIEYTSSGEAFSYTGVVIGYTKSGQSCRLDYNFYSNEEKIKIRKINEKGVKQGLLILNQLEYDTQDKVQFPCEMVIASFLAEDGTWKFRISKTPTIQIKNVITSLE